MKSDILRGMAGAELDKILPNSAPRPRDDLITSVVRQWVTNAGKAGVFTIPMSYWLNMEPAPDDLFVVSIYAMPSELCRTLLVRGAQDAHIPAILRGLSLRQSAVFSSDAGNRLRIHVSPIHRCFVIEDADSDV